jgi:TatD DNase family protein
MQLFDTHCHIDVGEFDADREQVIRHARELGVSRMLVPAVAAATWPGLMETCRRHPGLHPALGLHPVYQSIHEEADLERLEEWVARERPVAIGEIGLDFFIHDPQKQEQIRFFEAQLRIAKQHGLPVVLHVRKAHDQVLQSLKKIGVNGGTSHAFNGSLQQARQYIDMGFKLGFGGMLTYERSSKLRRLAAELPLSSLVLETDAPDMTVADHHGQRNSPEYLPECLAALAKVKGMPEEEVAAITTENAMAVFGLSPD